MSSELLKIIKQAAMDAVKSAKPVELLFGSVVSVSPLAVKISPTITLPSQHLILTKAVMDYQTDVVTSGGSRQQWKICNGLHSGDSVILLQMQGAQKYLVIDKVVDR